MKNPVNYAFFGSLIIPENDLIFKKRQQFNMFRKWEGFFTHACFYRFHSPQKLRKLNA